MDETIGDDYLNTKNEDNDLNYDAEEAASSGSSEEDGEDCYSLQECNTVDQL